MKTSKVGINLIKSFESLHDGDLSLIGLQPKMCPAKVWTEGWGRALRDSKGNFIKGSSNKNLAYQVSTVKNEIDAERALQEDLNVFERIVIQKVKVPLNQNQFDALVSYTYNTGGSDTLFKMINKGEHPDNIKNWFITKYISAGGKTLPGLVRRRKAERDLYFS